MDIYLYSLLLFLSNFIIWNFHILIVAHLIFIWFILAFLYLMLMSFLFIFLKFFLLLNYLGMSRRKWNLVNEFLSCKHMSYSSLILSSSMFTIFIYFVFISILSNILLLTFPILCVPTIWPRDTTMEWRDSQWKVDRELANHSLSSTASQGTSDIPFPWFLMLGCNSQAQDLFFRK